MSYQSLEQRVQDELTKFYYPETFCKRQKLLREVWEDRNALLERLNNFSDDATEELKTVYAERDELRAKLADLESDNNNLRSAWRIEHEQAVKAIELEAKLAAPLDVDVQKRIQTIRALAEIWVKSDPPQYDWYSTTADMLERQQRRIQELEQERKPDE